jgi:hypothetical protein
MLASYMSHFSTLNMKAACSYKASVDFQRNASALYPKGRVPYDQERTSSTQDGGFRGWLSDQLLLKKGSAPYSYITNRQRRTK